MKKIYMIGGPMGVGKTSVCQNLKRKLKNSVMLDGDWCWDMNPAKISDKTKLMVVDNITYLLNNFIKCSAIENIIFCWVMHQQKIIDDIISNLHMKNCRIAKFSLVCDENILTARLQKDIVNGLRFENAVEKSISYLPLYKNLDTIKIDTSLKNIEQIVHEIIAS